MSRVSQKLSELQIFLWDESIQNLNIFKFSIHEISPDILTFWPNFFYVSTILIEVWFLNSSGGVSDNYQQNQPLQNVGLERAKEVDPDKIFVYDQSESLKLTHTNTQTDTESTCVPI